MEMGVSSKVPLRVGSKFLERALWCDWIARTRQVCMIYLGSSSFQTRGVVYIELRERPFSTANVGYCYLSCFYFV